MRLLPPQCRSAATARLPAALLAAALALSGCAGPRGGTGGSVGGFALERDRGLLAVRPEGRAAVPLKGFTAARLLGAWPAGKERVAAVEGRMAGCRLGYALVAVPPSGAGRVVRLPGCDRPLSFSSDSTHVFVAGSEDGRPRYWRYADGALTMLGDQPAAPPPEAAGTPLPPVSPDIGEGVVPSPVGTAPPAAPPPAVIRLW